jgi:hypothetical protein
LSTSFPSGAYLYNYSNYGGGFYKYANELGSTVVPAGGYFVFSYKNPEPSELWKNSGGRPITILQNGVETGTVAVTRKDGPNGDAAFKGTVLPESTRPILPADAVTTDFRYTAIVPRVTDATDVQFVARVDGSAENVLPLLTLAPAEIFDTQPMSWASGSRCGLRHRGAGRNRPVRNAGPRGLLPHGHHAAPLPDDVHRSRPCSSRRSTTGHASRPLIRRGLMGPSS